MLRNIQIKIVLIFLVIGIVIIGVMGYINYTNLQKIIGVTDLNVNDSILVLLNYQNNLKLITIGSICIFTLACILVRCFCYTKNNLSNFEID